MTTFHHRLAGYGPRLDGVPRRIVTMLFACGLALSLAQLGYSADAATTCSLTPVLRDFTINQGVGSLAQPAANYSPLTRGKETLVRLYLSKPSCATRGQSIGLTSATLTMNVPGSAAKTYSTLSPLSTTSPAPLFDYTAAAAPDAAGDPKFVIPGPDLISSSPTSRFTPTFTATINCTTCANAVRFSSISGQTTPIAATVEQKTKALRILVVPMGAALTSTDNRTLQAGLNNLSRMLPVPKAGGQLTGSLSSTSSVGGIRYAVNSGVASVPMVNGNYCGNLNNFDAIKAQLAQYRNDWNVANSANTTNPDANPTADIVLGVISSSISLDGTSGCAEGMASTRSPEAWVRLVPAGTSPSTAGSLMAMEVAHTFGAEGAWADSFSPTHSRNAEADAATNRAYNITTRSFVTDDRSAMKSTGTGWDQESTVYEQRDYNFLMCRLGGRPNADCLTTGTVGTVSGVANGPTFVMSGKTDNTAQGTDVVESFTNENVAFTERPATSPYTLRFLHGGTAVSQVPVDVNFATSMHTPGENADQRADTGLFTLSVPFPLNADPNRIEFVYQPPGETERVLFTSNKNGQPTLRHFTASGSGDGGFVNYTATDNGINNPLGDDLQPALTQDGKFIAWIGYVDGYALEVASTSDINQTDFRIYDNGIFPTHPAWSPDGTQIAFAEDGDIFTVPVDTTGSAPVMGQRKLIYDSGSEGPPAADNPSFSPKGSQIAFDAAYSVEAPTNVFVMDSNGDNIEQLTNVQGQAADPSWSQTPGDNRIAFTNSGDIHAIKPVAGSTPDVLVEGGYQPSWGNDGIVAYNGDGSIHTIDTNPDLTLALSEAPLDAPAIDGNSGNYPAYVSRGISAFERSFNDGESYQTDIMLERPGISVTATGGIDGGSTDRQSLENLRLTLYYRCPGTPERSVLGLALPPTGFSNVGTPDATASFSQTFDETELCGGQGGGTVTAVLSDFFTSSPFPGQTGFDPVIQNEPIDSSTQPPVATIVDPIDDARFFDWETVALQGEGSDPFLHQLSDANLSWSIDGTSIAQSRTASGSTVDLAALLPGDYTVTLTVTDPDSGLSDETSTQIHVVNDADRDGMSDEFETTQPCFPAGASLDGNSINLDSDTDGIPDGQDSDPCVAAQQYTPTVAFNPNTLFLPSKGTYVTMYVTQDHGSPSLASVAAGSVRITSITGVLLGGSTPMTISVADQLFSTNRVWTVSGTAGRDQLGTAKFDRQQLNAFIIGTFKLRQTLRVTLDGYSSVPGWTFSGSGTTTVKKG